MFPNVTPNDKLIKNPPSRENHFLNLRGIRRSIILKLNFTVKVNLLRKYKILNKFLFLSLSSNLWWRPLTCELNIFFKKFLILKKFSRS